MPFPSFHSLMSFSAVACGLIAAVTDLRERRIPNWLTASALLAGLTLHAVAGGWRELGAASAALLICGTIFLLFHLAGGMGAGDVKLIAAEAALLGFSNIAPLLIYTALFGGALALVIAIRNGRFRSTVFNVFQITTHHSRNGLVPHPDLNVMNAAALRLPYAVPIAAGVILTLSLPSSFGGAL